MIADKTDMPLQGVRCHGSLLRYTVRASIHTDVTRTAMDWLGTRSNFQ